MGEGGTALQATYVILIVVLAALVVAVIADRRRVVRLIISFLPDFEDPEVVTVQDIRMLASLRLRRLGRHWARLNLGIAGKQAMTQYQLAATELAMACRRKSLGQTTEDAYVQAPRRLADPDARGRGARPRPGAAVPAAVDRPGLPVRLRHLPRPAAALARPAPRLAEESGLEVGGAGTPPRDAAATPCGRRPSRTR